MFGILGSDEGLIDLTRKLLSDGDNVLLRSIFGLIVSNLFVERFASCSSLLELLCMSCLPRLILESKLLLSSRACLLNLGILTSLFLFRPYIKS